MRLVCADCLKNLPPQDLITVTEKCGGDVILTEHFCDWDCLARYYRKELGKP